MNEPHHTPAAAELLIGDPPADDHGHEAEHVAKHVALYVKVGVTLLVCTALTVFLSYVDFGSQKANVAVAMLVATFKAGLVALIFMHLNAEKKLIYRIMAFTVIFVFALFWLTYLHWYDPIAR